MSSPRSVLHPQLEIMHPIRLLPVLLSFVTALALGAPLTAQYIRARTHLEKLRSLANEVQPDRDESRIESTCKEIIDTATAMSSAMADIGETLMRASGPYESERSEIHRMAQTLRRLTDEVSNDARNLIAHFSRKSSYSKVEDYKSDLTYKCQDVRMEIANGIGRDWAGIENAISKTRGWMREQLNAALTLRDNAAKPLAGLQQIEEQLLARMAASNQIVQTAFHRWWESQTKLAEANTRENAASQAYAAARSSDADQSRLASLYDTLKRALADKQAAAAAVHTASDALQRATNDSHRAISDMVRPMEDIRNFVDSANADTINKRWTDFDQWTKLLERDLGRS